MEVVDPRLGTDYNREEAMKMIQIGILCTSLVPSDRPSMSTVVSMLEGHSTVDVEEILETSFSRGNEKDEESPVIFLGFFLFLLTKKMICRLFY